MNLANLNTSNYTFLFLFTRFAQLSHGRLSLYICGRIFFGRWQLAPNPRTNVGDLLLRSESKRVIWNARTPPRSRVYIYTLRAKNCQHVLLLWDAKISPWRFLETEFLVIPPQWGKSIGSVWAWKRTLEIFYRSKSMCDSVPSSLCVHLNIWCHAPLINWQRNHRSFELYTGSCCYICQLWRRNQAKREVGGQISRKVDYLLLFTLSFLVVQWQETKKATAR